MAMVIHFLAHMSWKLKWAIPITCCPSVNFYILDFFSRTTGPILTRLGTNHPWEKGIKVYSNEGERLSRLSPRGDNSKRVKVHWKILKIFFSRTTGPNSINTKQPQIKGIQVFFLNKGPGPLQRGDNHKNMKMGWGHLKIFTRTTWPMLSRLSTNHPWGGIQVSSNEGKCRSPRGDNGERVKVH
jgi:hypothetical protein